MTDSGVEIGGRFGRLYRWLDWPVRLAVLNLLWLAGVLAGAVVAGVAPATVALYALLREYVLGRRPEPWRDFWRHWRTEFGPAQPRLGVPLLTVWVLVFYLLLARGTPLAAAVSVLLLAYLATLLYLPAVLAHFRLPTSTAWRVAVLAAWRHPVWTIGLGLACALLVVGVWYVFPGALPFLMPSLPALLATKSALRSFELLTESPQRERDQRPA